MAKKVRTPPPPRRVQAPQRRDTKRRDSRAGPPVRTGIPPVWVAIGGAAALVAIGLLVFFLVHGNGGTSQSSSAPVSTFNSLPGVTKTKAPWLPEYTHLSDRLPGLNLTANSTEQLAYHIHQHLDIFLNGKRIAVPPAIGINDDSYITELHTHDTSGVIHVEAPSNKHYTLGSFFAEWGVFLNRKCVGAYCGGYKWYVNGKLQTGNPQKLSLEPHQEIAIIIGKPPKKIPSTYTWGSL